jgi:hypothetical protein
MRAERHKENFHSILGFLLGFAVLFLTCPSGSAAKIKSTIDIPVGSSGIVSYGSLISLPSMEQTLKHKYEGSVHKIHLTGYERAWTCLSPPAWAAGQDKIETFFLRNNERVPFVGTVQLNIHPSREGRINGILYLVTDQDLVRLDKRENGYRRVDVTGKIEEFRFHGGKVYAYEGLPQDSMGSPPEKGTYIVIKEFFDQVARACDGVGKDFRDEFDRSTRPCEYEIVSIMNIRREKAK